MPRAYPQPGTNAERVLHFVTTNEGTTTNKVITALNMNPSVVRKCLRNLTEKGLIVDTPDNEKNHHYSVKVLVA